MHRIQGKMIFNDDLENVDTHTKMEFKFLDLAFR